MRFSIRDLLWLTVVVALAVGWSIDRRRLAEMNDRLSDISDLTKAIQTYKRAPGDYPPNSSPPIPNLPSD